jgi:trans-2,3-dihydro-3-hydroxyanthranilate isomerase
MGRPSVLLASVSTREGVTQVRVGGHCVSVMDGTFELEGEER